MWRRLQFFDDRRSLSELERAACAALEYIITMMNMNSATGPNVKLTAIGKRPEDVEYT